GRAHDRGGDPSRAGSDTGGRAAAAPVTRRQARCCRDPHRNARGNGDLAARGGAAFRRPASRSADLRRRCARVVADVGPRRVHSRPSCDERGSRAGSEELTLTTPNSKLQTPNSKLQTSNFELQTPNFKTSLCLGFEVCSLEFGVPTYSSFPGFMIPSGSSVALIARMT